MDYKKKYEKLVDAVKVLRDNNPSDEGIHNWVNDNVPELKESEDERIKKEIIEYIKTGTYHKKWIAWLEKQGNKPQGKSALEAIRDEKVDNANKIEPKDYSSIDPYFGKPIDNVEPKFHEGDWTVSKLDRKVRQISEVHFDEHNSYYMVNGKDVNLEEYDRLHHSWTIQDAKDGDVLATEDKNFITPFVAIYKSIGDTVYDNITFNSHCFIGFDGNFYGGEEGHSIEDIYPATREQRKLLFQRMKEAGYKWDAEKKELRKEEVK